MNAKRIVFEKYSELSRKSHFLQILIRNNSFRLNKKLITLRSLTGEKEIRILKSEYLKIKNKLSNELLTEGGFLGSPNLFSLSKKYFFWNLDLRSLKKLNLLHHKENVLYNFMNQVEDLPDKSKEDLINYCQNQTFLSFAKIRSAVEQKYLAYKFNVEEESIYKIYCYFKSQIFQGYSLNNVHKNLKLLSKIKNSDKWTLANKILFLNLIPCDNYLIKRFEEFPDLMKWYNLYYCRPNRVHWPLKIVLNIINLLKENNFNDKQIHEALKLRTHAMIPYFKKLILFLNSEELSKFRNDNEFFHLLRIPLPTLLKLPQLDDLYLNHLEEYKNKSENFDKYTEKQKAILALREMLGGSLNLSNEKFAMLRKHPNWLELTESEVFETFHYLTTNFSEIEIIESLPIILYSRNIIEEGIEEISSKKKDLIKFGLQEDYVSDTNLFEGVSKTKNKKLSLCLYFLDKKFNFL